MRFQPASARHQTAASRANLSASRQFVHPWRLRFAVCLLALSVVVVPGAEILRDSFSYRDGSLFNVSGGRWVSFGGPTGQVDVVAGKMVLTQTENEDAAASFAAGPQSNGQLYASFVVNFSELPAGAGSFFAAFKDGGSVNFRCRVFASTFGAGPGSYRVGIANTTNGTPNNLIPIDLALNTDYVLVLRYDVGSPVVTNSTLWIDPVSELDTNNQAVATDNAGAAFPLSAFAVRQNAGIGGLKFDNLKVATTFNEVAWQQYELNINSGYDVIANQLDRGDNTLEEILPAVPDGTYLHKFDNAVGIYLSAYYTTARGWDVPNLTLHPGEAAFIRSPSFFNHIFKGTARTPVLPLPPCAGFRFLSCQSNSPGTYENIVGGPLDEGTTAYIWNGVSHDTFVFTFGQWEPAAPTVPIGRAMWITLPQAATSCPGEFDHLTPPPSIILQPQSQTLPAGTLAILSVEATGATSFQWRRNGVNLPGEVGTSLNIDNIQPTNSGAYSVVLANAGGAIVSQIAVLEVLTGDLGFADNYADRIVITGDAGTGSGSNTNATKQAAEPDHAANSGGKSVWLAWQAPASGIATFSTAGSSFDTLLAVYRGVNPGGFKHTASDDDSAGFYASEVRFNAVAGNTYDIAVDGSYGASGRIVLTWNLEITTATVPEITTQPKPRLVIPETPFILSVGASTIGSLPLEYQWFQNNQPIPGAVTASYTNPNALPPDAGVYRVQVRTPPPAAREVFSRPVSVQLSVVQLGAFANVIAPDKFLDSTSLGASLDFLFSLRGDGSDAAPVGGFTGTQIFSTYGAAKEPGEPNHCGEPGGASYWFAYQSPANGRLSVTTTGSAYDTVLAVYSGPDPVTSFSQLSCAACANATGPGNEVVEFDTVGGTIYYLAVDGVGGASGVVNLTYNMVTARPVIANQPQHTAVTAGHNGSVSVAIANTSVPPLYYQWQFNAANLLGATQSSYTRPGFQPAHQGNYRVIVTNLVGAVTSSVAMMYLDTPPIQATNSFINGGGFFESQWLGPTGSLLTVQVSTDLTNWSSVITGTATTGFINYTDSSPAGLSQRYYRTLLAFP